MNISDIFLRAGRNLRESKARTVLTALAIAVGAATITVAMAAGNGGRTYTNAIVQSSGDSYSLDVYPKYEAQKEETTSLPEYGVENEDDKPKAKDYLTDKDIESLKKLEGVQSISPKLDIEARYATRGSDQKKLVAPLSVKADRTKVDLAAGTLSDNMISAGQMIIAEGFLKSFGFASAEQAIGQTITLNVAQLDRMGAETGETRDYKFTIVAVDKPSDTAFFYHEALRVSAEDGQAIYRYHRGEDAVLTYYGVVVLAKKEADVSKLQKTIADRGYDVYSLEDQREQMLQVINIAQWGLIGFGALAVIASVFGIINTQYISVLERTQQIGLMKAVGASRRDVARLFRYEAAWVGFLGGVIGVSIGYLATLFNPLIADVLDLDAGTELLIMDWTASAILVIGLMLISIMSGYFPSRKAAKLDPIEALRTE